ncbi:class I SAM-dependent DNA methyltransferase [Candidatus Eisenbacteria bacterium]|uniref:Class I SAM-dependent DNA methyltransferase n=1 Tax=Eiseniibacteriota bacterium TaxID=2212470 RepID=A0ABV6YPB6_UNCEI
MTDDPYADFAERYDLFHESLEERNPARVEFFRKVFAENKVRSILDCACGTGRDLALFHSLGLEVIGSDISESMLGVARVNLSGCGIDIPLSRADYRELGRSHDRQFDAVVCLSSSLLEMPDEREALEALKSMSQVLKDGGVLIISQGTTDKMWAEKPRFIPAVNRPDFSRIFVIDYKDKGARFNILDLFHETERTEFKVWTKEYGRILLKDDHEKLLAEAGFSSIEFYGSYGFAPYDKTSSDLLICVARR